MPIRLGAIAALLFGSGFAALVYQTVWQKTFRFVFGASSEASAAVLGIFLGGLGLGGLILGRRAEKSRNPLKLYGDLEIGIALLAAASPFLIEGATLVYVALGGSVSLGKGGAALVRLALATLAIGPAAFLMGGTLPAAARAAVTDDDGARRGLARIYALNTLGAVLGALVGPLLLFGAVGIRTTLFAAVCINLLVGLSARALSRGKEFPSPIGHKKQKAQVAASKQEGAPEKAPVPPKESVSPYSSGVIYALAALVGFAFLYMELVWFRMLAPILGGSTVTFGLILAVALSGIGLGGWLYSVWAPPSSDATRSGPSIHTLTVTLALEALFIIVPFAWGDGLALMTAHLRAMANLGYLALLGGWIFVTAVVVLPTSIVSGYQFPVLFALLGRGRTGVAKEVGAAYAFNTIGTISGSILGGFVLIPLLGAVPSWRLVAMLLVASASLLALLRPIDTLKNGRPVLLVAIVAVTLPLLLANGPGTVWRHTPIGAGRVDLARLTPNGVRDWTNDQENSVDKEFDGVEAALAISNNNGISFLVNGKSDGSIVGDRGTQIMLGLIPAGIHPQPKRAFVVGLGTGTTAGMLGLVPEINHVDVAEIEPAVLHVAEMSALANGQVLKNPKVHVLTGDARELLLGAKQKYDLIVSEPSNPYRIGVATLFTNEFYELAASQLGKGGLFAQWIQGYEIDAFTLATAIRTLKVTFPHVALWSPQGTDLVLVASKEPQKMDASLLRQRLANQPYKEWFVRARFVEGVEGFAAQQLIAAKDINKLLDELPGVVNTDDLNVMEFAFARSVGLKTELSHQLRDLVIGNRLEPDLVGKFDREELLFQRARLYPDDLWPNTPLSRATSMGCMGQMDEAANAWPEGREATDVVQHWVRGFVLATKNESEALVHAELLRQRGFSAEAYLIEAQKSLVEGDHAKARERLVSTYAALRKEALPLCEVPAQALKAGVELGTKDPKSRAAIFDALAQGHFAVYIADWSRIESLIQLGGQLDKNELPDPKRCVTALLQAEPFPRWSEQALQERWECYKFAKHPLAAQAEEDLLSYLRQEPTRFLPPKPKMPFPLPEDITPPTDAPPAVADAPPAVADAPPAVADAPPASADKP